MRSVGTKVQAGTFFSWGLTRLANRARRGLTDVREKFTDETGIQLPFFVSRLLAFYPEAHFIGLADRLSRFKNEQSGHDFESLLVDPHSSVGQEFDYASLSDDFIVRQINDAGALDLRDLQIKLFRFNRALEDTNPRFSWSKLVRQGPFGFRPPVEMAPITEPDVISAGQASSAALVRERAERFQTFDSQTATAADVIRLIESDIPAFFGSARVKLTYPNPLHRRRDPLERRWVRSISSSRSTTLLETGYEIPAGEALAAKHGKIPETTIKSLITLKGDQLVFVVDIADTPEARATFVDQGIERSAGAVRDLKCFQGDSEIIFVRLKLASGQVAAILQIDHLFRKDAIDAMPVGVPIPSLLPEDAKEKDEVLKALEDYFIKATRAIERLGRQQARIRRQIELQPQMSAIWGKPFSSDQYSAASRREEYLGLSIEANHDPRGNFEKIAGHVVTDAAAIYEKITGRRPNSDEIFEHAIKVNDSRTIRDGAAVVGFGTAKYLDGFVDGQRLPEAVTILFGTQIEQKYRRQGLMIKANFGLITRAKKIAKIAAKPFQRHFIKAPMVVRTQSLAVLKACQRHFAGVAAGTQEKPSARGQAIISFAAERMGWKIDGRNVQDNAYEFMMVEEAADLIPGLEPRQAIIISGDFTFGVELITKLFLNVVYPLRKWWKTLFRPEE